MRARSRRGFTIPELIIAMTILSIVGTLAVLLFSQVVHHFDKTSMDLDAERGARLAMAKVTGEIRQAVPNLADVNNNGIFCDDGLGNTLANGAKLTAIRCFKVDAIPTTTNCGGKPDWLPLCLIYDSVVIKFDGAKNQIVESVTPLQGPNAGKTVDSVLAHDVTSLTIQPVTLGQFDITITTSPPHRADTKQIYAGTERPYQIESEVYVSYFKP